MRDERLSVVDPQATLEINKGHAWQRWHEPCDAKTQQDEEIESKEQLSRRQCEKQGI
jgi:hypothetical protein